MGGSIRSMQEVLFCSVNTGINLEIWA